MKYTSMNKLLINVICFGVKVIKINAQNKNIFKKRQS